VEWFRPDVGMSNAKAGCSPPVAFFVGLAFCLFSRELWLLHCVAVVWSMLGSFWQQDTRVVGLGSGVGKFCPVAGSCLFP